MLSRIRCWWLQTKSIKKANAGVACPELRLLWRGDTDGARLLLGSRADDRSRFHLACVELEAGRFDDARACLARLPAADPARDVLDRLITTRANLSSPPFRAPQPEPSWLRGLEQAWMDAGSPDLRGHAWLGANLSKSRDVGQPPSELDDDERMLWLRMTWHMTFLSRTEPRPFRTWARTRSNDAELADLVIAAALFGAEGGAPVDRRAALERLIRRAPTNVSLRLARVCVRAPTRFTDDELTQLEAACAGNDYEPIGLDAVYERFERLAHKAGSGSAELLALEMANWSVVLPDLAALFAGVRQETNPTVRQRIARALAPVGSRLRGSRVLIMRFIGNAIAREAAIAAGDQAGLDEAMRVQAEASQFMAIDKHLRFDPSNWPLPSVMREAVAEKRVNEVAHYERYLKSPPR